MMLPRLSSRKWSPAADHRKGVKADVVGEGASAADQREGQTQPSLTRMPALAGPIRSVTSLFKELSPRGDTRLPPEQCAPLSLGHPAPDAELNPVVECLDEALGTYATPNTDDFRLILSRTPNEERISIHTLAGSQ
jgi:hypothetical protein